MRGSVSWFYGSSGGRWSTVHDPPLSNWGNHRLRKPRGGPSSGSSPRGRGTHADEQSFGHREVRFIPARAGNTRPLAPGACASILPVHPRAGGEHIPDNFSRYSRPAGSSPRGRGTRASSCPVPRGAMPVHPRAGGEHTTQPDRARVPMTVHPRAGGEHPALFVMRPGLLPVHPRAGGEHSGPVGVSIRSRHRFIPARAGNTRSASRYPRTRTVHPRAGGEHTVITALRVYRNGSSPRGRGTPCRRSPAPAAHRFIPARAGNTIIDSRAAT